MSSSRYPRSPLGRGNQNAQTSAGRRSDRISPAQGPRVLVLPFGKGVLSVYMLTMLRRLMGSVASVEGLDNIPLPCDYFDLICGAGLGGLFALLLSRLRMSVDEILDWIYSDVRWIYSRPPTNFNMAFKTLQNEQRDIPTWLQSLGVKSSFDRLWKGCILDLLTRYKMEDDLFFSPTGCRTCVLTSSASTTTSGEFELSVKRFRSYRFGDRGHSNVSIREVAWATVMDVSGDDERPLSAVAISIEGSMNCAAKRQICDADREAYDEMRHIWDSLSDSCFVEARSMRQKKNSAIKVFEWFNQNRDAFAQLLGDNSAQSQRLPRLNFGSSSSTHLFDFPNTVDTKPEDFSEFDTLRQWGDSGKATPIMKRVSGREPAFLECAQRLARPAPVNDSTGRAGVGIERSQERPEGRSSSQPNSSTQGSLFDIRYFTTASEPGAEQFFSKLKDGAQAYLGDLKAGEERIRVAILDTGINISAHPELQDACIGEAKAFGEFRNCDDEDGHGSHVAVMVNRVNPHVELFIAKVFRNTQDVNTQSVARIIDALKWAILEKNVHIVSMSFGFQREPANIEFRRLLVEDASREGVLLFAAASNHGANDSIPFPANLQEHVFSINSADAYGNPAQYATVRDEHGYNFTAIGDGVRGLQGLSQNEPPRTVSGSSIATSIVVGIVALILEFTGKRGVKIKNVSKLRTYKGMAKILKSSSREKYGFRFLTPNMLLSDESGNHKELGYWINVELSR